MDFRVGWMHPGNLATTEVRTLDRPARSILLYQLHYLRGAIKSA
jgi:hypothetical protein